MCLAASNVSKCPGVLTLPTLTTQKGKKLKLTQISVVPGEELVCQGLFCAGAPSRVKCEQALQQVQGDLPYSIMFHIDCSTLLTVLL